MKTYKTLSALQDRERERVSAIARHIENGVIFADMSAHIDPDVEIGEGTSILPGVILLQGTKIGSGCTIGPNTVICNGVIGDNATINSAQIYDSSVGSSTTVGPFAHIRNHCEVGEGCRIGNFVELKNSIIKNGSKMSHLTYIGDTDMGENVNMGCGTITVNYDGVLKHRTVIGDNAFVGCNSNLIAPVTVGRDTLIAAGTTVHEDVPDGALAISRPRQTTIADAAARIFKKKKAQKK